MAFVHTAATYSLVVFVVVHVHLATTGHTFSANLKAMVIGWEELADEGAE